MNSQIVISDETTEAAIRIAQMTLVPSQWPFLPGVWFDWWRKFYMDSEKAMNDQWIALTTAPDYARVQGQILDINLFAIEEMRNFVKYCLQLWGLAGMDDVARLGGMVEVVGTNVNDVRNRMRDIDRKLDEIVVLLKEARK